jgi:hypothetical protein
MNIKEYIISGIWSDNPYLVIPPNQPGSVANSAHKKCQLCQEVKFTVEYLDNDQFIDKKIPVCTDCLKMHDGKGRQIVNDTSKTMECVKCGQQKLLGAFQINAGRNILDNRCLDCERTRLKKLR